MIRRARTKQGGMERLLAYQGPVVNADHSHRVAAPTAGCDEDLGEVQKALDKATKLKDKATLLKDIRTEKLEDCLRRELDDEEEKRELEEQIRQLEADQRQLLTLYERALRALRAQRHPRP